MAHYRRADVPGGSYFFTVVTERRRAILTDLALRQALRAAIDQVRATRPFRIDGWVLLPDHLHAIWTLPAGDADFATRWRLIKSHVTRRCGADCFRADWLTRHRANKRCGTLWQHRYWEYLLRDEVENRGKTPIQSRADISAWLKREGIAEGSSGLIVLNDWLEYSID